MEVKTDTQVVSITEKAVSQVEAVIAQQNLDNLFLRIYVQGGCGGIQYGMALDTRIQEGDQEYEISGMKIVIDRISFPYVEGATVDFDDSGEKPGFRIENPNAAELMSAAGGCGSCGVAGSCSASGGHC